MTDVDPRTRPPLGPDQLSPPPRRPRGRASRAGDLRAPLLGLVAWLAALTGLRLPVPWVAGCWCAAAVAVVLVVARRPVSGRARWQLAVEPVCWLLVSLVVATLALLRVHAVRASPVPQVAAGRAEARVTVRLTGDPVARAGRFSGYVLARGTVEAMTARGTTWRDLHAPVLLLAPTSWRSVTWGQTVQTGGRLERAQGVDLAAVVQVRGPPAVIDRGAPWLRVADRVRAGVRRAVAGRPDEPRALVPALVDGDVQAIPRATEQDFRTAGLTHLLAVSGTNLTLVVGALLIAARGVGVRARGLTVVGALGVVGFVVLARPEPSVLRAAAMGTVALLGLGSGGTARAGRTLGVGVLVLLLADPWLAQEIGFALSAVATAGIVYLAPGWRDALRRWLPRWLAEAVAVPLAAQVVCTPLVAAISGQVSLVAVAANLLAAPVVGPATVLGLVGGVLSAVWAPLGGPFGWAAGWCASWLVLVAHRSSAVPTAAVGWAADPVSLVVLTLICAGLAALLGRLLARRSWTILVGVAAVVAMLAPAGLPTPGWPPSGWVMVACDVGQGDGLVLRVGEGSAVVVDTGTDPAFIDRCLRRLHVRHVPLVVLTHFHADHVGGLPGVLRHRRVDAVEITTFDQPTSGFRQVSRLTAQAHVPVRVVRLGERVHVGDVAWRVLAPAGPPPADSDSPPNDASIVMLVQVHGLRVLMTGDEESGSQSGLATRIGALRVDVLKVAHHGSSKQDAALVRSLHPRLALISVGVRNVYGHPAPSTLRLLRQAGATVARTDLEGDVAVTVDGAGRLGVAHRMPAIRPPPGGVG